MNQNLAARRALLAFALLLVAGTAQARVLDSAKNGFTVENSATAPVDARTAWNGLVKHVDAWWPKEHSWFGKDGRFSITARAGGCFCEIAGARQVQHMTVSFADPGKLLRMLGGLGPLQGMGLSGTLDWSFAPADAGTRLTLRYIAGGYSQSDLAKFAPVVDQVQAQQLGALAAWLALHPK